MTNKNNPETMGGKLTRKLFLKKGWKVIEGTIVEVTPRTTWIRTKNGTRAALDIEAQNTKQVAQVNDALRAVVVGKEVVQIYSPNTAEHLVLQRIVAPLDWTSGLLGFVAVLAVLIALVPLYGLITSWMALLVLLGNVFRSLRPARHFVILLAVCGIYFGGALALDRYNGDTIILGSIIFVMNCILIFGPILHVTREGGAAHEELGKILSH